MQPKYRMSPSLLNAFWWFKNSEYMSEKEIWESINRIKTTPSKAMLRGIAFEKIIDDYKDKPSKLPKEIFIDSNWIEIDDNDYAHKFCIDSLRPAFQEFKGALSQVFVNKNYPTRHGTVQIVGYIDEIKADKAYDIKCTSRVEVPKFSNSYQHRFYLSALQETGIKEFVYWISNGKKSTTKETYVYKKQFEQDIISECEFLIDFVNDNPKKLLESSKLLKPEVYTELDF